MASSKIVHFPYFYGVTRQFWLHLRLSCSSAVNGFIFCSVSSFQLFYILHWLEKLLV